MHTTLPTFRTLTASAAALVLAGLAPATPEVAA